MENKALIALMQQLEEYADTSGDIRNSLCLDSEDNEVPGMPKNEPLLCQDYNENIDAFSWCKECGDLTENDRKHRCDALSTSLADFDLLVMSNAYHSCEGQWRLALLQNSFSMPPKAIFNDIGADIKKFATSYFAGWIIGAIITAVVFAVVR